MSFPTASDLADYPGLIPWLTGDTWKKDFDDAAMANCRLHKVVSIDIIEEPSDFDDDSDLLVSALVQEGTNRPRRTKIYLYSEYNRETRTVEIEFQPDCSCYESMNCSHTAAVIVALKTIAIGTRGVASTRVSSQQAAWLRRIKEAAAPAKKSTSPAKPSTKFLAYCIETYINPYASKPQGFQFSLRPGNLKKIGFSIESNNATGDPLKPTKFMAPEDLPICGKYHQRIRKLRLWGSTVALEGGDWEEILIPAAATGRLFFGSHDSSYSRSYEYSRLAEGPPLPVETTWELLPDGGMRPILRLPSPEIYLIQTEPLFYLDSEKQLLGHVQSHLPAALLGIWASGPIIPASQISNLSHELAEILPENPLPLPSEKPAQIFTDLVPTPILHITEVHVGVFQKRHIGGILKIQYPGRPPFFPLAPNAPSQTSWIEGETRMVLQRNCEIENGFFIDLIGAGFAPISEFYQDRELTEKTRYSYVLESPKASPSEWLSFLSSPDAKILKDKGWIIETDPKLGLTIHDIHDFFPAIEADADHGIDWFRFDVTGEFEGKQISLIPQIARAIAEDWHLRYPDPETLPETILLPCDKPADGHIRFPAKRFLEMVAQVRHLFHGHGHGTGTGAIRLDRLNAAGVADALAIDTSETTRSLAKLGRNLRDIQGLPPVEVPATLQAELRHYQVEGFRWLQFLADHGLHGILADDMGLGKTVQTLAHLAAVAVKSPGKPSLVIAPTSVVPNWAAEAEKFAPHLNVLVLQGGDRAENFDQISTSQIVITSYPLLVRDFDQLEQHNWQTLVLDEAQYIKNSKAISSYCACKLKAAHRLCLSGTPMENHLGELWSLMRFLMPGFLADEKTFNTFIRKPIERDHSQDAQLALNRRVSPLILRRTKDQVATELPEKTTLIHNIDLTPRQTDLYESVRAAMDVRVRDAISTKGIAKSHIIVLDALLKLRQICCHPQLLKSEAAQRVLESAKLEYLSGELLPTLLEEGRRILIFSQFTSMLALIEEHLQGEGIDYLKLTGQTKERATLVKKFQSGEVPVFLISLKAGGTGLNLTAADTVIHYDPWWNPAAENQATDRVHRIGQNKPVFVHKLVCRGTIEERILELQKHKSALVEALLSEETTKLRIDAETLSHLLAPLESTRNPQTKLEP